MNQLARHRLPNLKSATPAPLQVEDGDLDLGAMVRLIRRRARFIGVVVLVATLLALPVIMAAKHRYYAETRFLIQRPLSEPRASEAVLDPANEVERLRSHDIARRVIDRFALDALPEFNPDLTPRSPFGAALAAMQARWQAPSETVEEGGATEQRVLTEFFERLTVRREGDSMILVGFIATEPDLAAAVPNAMVEFYVADREARQKDRIDAASERLAARIAAQRERVSEAAALVRAYQQEHNVTSVGRGGTLDDSRLVLLNEQLAEVQRRRADLRGRIDTIEGAISGDGPPPPDATGTLAELRQSLVEQQRDLARLTASYGEGYGGVTTARARISETEAAIETELRGLRNILQVQDGHLADDEAALTDTRDALEAKLSRSSVAELELARLLRRTDARSETLGALEDEQRQLQDMMSAPVLDLEILAEATPPAKPVSRSKKVYLLLVVATASALALTAAGALELGDRSVRSQQQLAALPGAIPVGMLPESARPDRAGTPAADQRMSDALRGVLLTMDVLDEGIPARSLLVTTAGPREGAVVVAHGLARHLVSGGTGVLVVEAVAQHGLFGNLRLKPGPRGLAEYLRKEARLADLIRQDPATNVHVLSYGNGPLTPLHDRTPVQRIVDYASARNLRTIFVCPPVLNSASTLHIATGVDRVLLVARWGVTPVERVSLALNRLRSSGVDSALTLLNRVDPRRNALYSFRDAAAFPKSARADLW